MKWLKRKVAKLFWKICGISPNWGNRVMDLIGYENYCKVMWYEDE